MNLITITIHKMYIIIAIIGIIAIGLFIMKLFYLETYFLMFLAWNLFLAYVPLAISSFITYKKSSKYKLWGLSLLWLLFLPNAPYIFTDFIHLKSNLSHFWFDFVMILMFAISGLLAGLYSIYQLHLHFKTKIKQSIQWTIIVIISFLCGLGIYLGRVIRFNSWDILHRPFSILLSVFKIFIHPINNQSAWYITFGFGVFIFISYVLMYRWVQPKKE
ncbi:membrane protein [Neptunitalea chrysea]|uniref:Membrane protein n=1 Tax=Neptunitalea chrysea TaxID=1647581 RepID=A0A9W6EUK0_9FLAO|nr:DUF1361 domain-containing protein [Neptunitalea chrysea]GLB53600.1 membrane protein [Neptunitalea chrysea]